eukprot:1451929-Rhodomonas_salina.6
MHTRIPGYQCTQYRERGSNPTSTEALKYHAVTAPLKRSERVRDIGNPTFRQNAEYDMRKHAEVIFLANSLVPRSPKFCLSYAADHGGRL